MGLAPKSLRKNRLISRAFPFCALITLRSSLVSTFQDLKAAGFRPAAPSGQPDRIRLATPLGNMPFMVMPLPSPA
jgi:hypothetical protein